MIGPLFQFEDNFAAGNFQNHDFPTACFGPVHLCRKSVGTALQLEVEGALAIFHAALVDGGATEGSLTAFTKLFASRYFLMPVTMT